MHFSLPKENLAAYVARQLTNFFPDTEVSAAEIAAYLDATLARLETCFSAVNNKYYFDGETVHFNHLHSDQYASFLYLLSNTIFRQEGSRDLATKIYYLNKALHSLDVYYEVSLPDVFFFMHPVGTVLGRATYGSHLVVYQRCTVGANMDLEYPTIGQNVALFGNSAVVGNSVIGDNSLVAAGALVMDQAIPAGSVAFGVFPHVGAKPTTKSVRDFFFRA